MITSRFLFQRGDTLFEVLVSKKWNKESLQLAKISTKKAIPLFLEEDDFQVGGDAFALDFFLMKKTGKHLWGENILKIINVSKKKLRGNIESEVRRLATKVRAAYFYKEGIPITPLVSTLSGISEGLTELGLNEALPNDFIKEIKSITGIFSPIKRSAPLLTLLQRWEDFLERKI